MHALMVARNQRFPEIKTQGLWGLARSGIRPVVFTSAHAHYSIEKAAIAAGVGLENVVFVPTDDRGCMDAEALRTLVVREIESGGTPFFVNATAGTTVLSAFDPLDEISAVCQEFDIWLHVDGSWGGPLALFGDKSLFNYRIPAGKVNSLTVNPHKLLGIPMQCSFLLVRDGLGVMRDSLGLGATYLYHSAPPDAVDQDDEERHINSQYMQRLGGSWDLGDATMGCGRRPDAIKMWISWRYYGTQYFCDRVSRARQLAIDFAKLIVSRSTTKAGRWKLFTEPQSISVCFWFIPHSQAQRYENAADGEGESLRKEEYAEWWGDVTKALCDRINADGAALVDYATVERFRAASAGRPGEFVGHKVPYFFRIPFNNPNVTLGTQSAVLDAIEDASRAIYG
ncbi:Glutamate decarboxylase 2 [Coemansia sp. RSA 2598]|nr:Glutamate decarboxylase 2 [Coemansia sp. RSA 2598]